MGRVYANEDDHVVVELTPEDILYRFVPDGNGGMLSMRTLIKDLAWFILNTHPSGKKMAEKRLYPAINVNRSGTRREELLIPQELLQKVWVLRKLLYPMDDMEAMEFLLDKIRATKNNGEFFDSMRRG